MYFIGYDIGSSSVKAAVLDGDTGQIVAAAQYPQEELNIHAPQPGWAEQDPQVWWDCVVQVTAQLCQHPEVRPEAIVAIGISYQMHGLVLVDHQQE
ncbi:MAG: FGGY family carbohydrate kinase, partial [Bacteroidota bacterium]